MNQGTTAVCGSCPCSASLCNVRLSAALREEGA